MPRVDVGKVIGWLRRVIEIFDYGRAREWGQRRGGRMEGVDLEQPAQPGAQIGRTNPTRVGRQR